MAQSPVKWSFTSKKTGDKQYELYLTATVNDPWHIYSQSTPEGGPLPTKISFNKNPLITLQGKINEQGKLKTRHEEVFGVDVRYFDGSVTFTQTIKLKTNAKGDPSHLLRTNLSGTVEFMVCNDEQCMPPTEVSFSIVLQ